MSQNEAESMEGGYADSGADAGAEPVRDGQRFYRYGAVSSVAAVESIVMRVLPILLLALAAPVQAQTPAAPPPPATPRQPPATIVAEPAAMFIAACDSDGDGKTTRAELTACVARSFADADTAHAGSIGYIGYSDWALKWLGDRNALPSPFGVDADGDNRITLAEVQAQFARLFDRFDLDKDGAATRAELVTIRGSAAPDGSEGKRGRRGGGAR